MRGTFSHLSRFLASPAVALSVVLAGAAIAETRPGEGPTSAPSTSTPIELPDAPALPSQHEVVGGFVAVLLGALGLLFIVGIVVVVILESTHHHLFGDCEECRHHGPPNQPRRVGSHFVPDPEPEAGSEGN
jgi:hypothetical protein